ncbi:ABC transporter ATP-binding protein [Desulfosporosinus sp. FKA]|uniref:ABC transporter ATP-binding protein n=1 Tax=Desulfosporosinus sp. FKA TaxID=1969834 RepID=UPI000B49776C|nr:ABC transporter ATP-binding protein [Desulfosporosinus sp. FKA]
MISLEIRDVWKYYQARNGQKNTILKGLNLQVKQGEMVAVMGPSGSGKTTLLNIISGVDCSDQGSVWIDGQYLAEMNKAETALFRRRSLGMVFQDFNLIESLSVKENILLPMILEKKPAEEQEEQAEKILKILGIEDIRDQSITEISGGERQRTAIGRALINNPALILADEPTGNLDSKHTREVMNFFLRINREFGTTLLMVTHDTFAASHCHRTVLLKDGEFVAEEQRTGSRKEFLDSLTEMLTLMGGEQDDLF